MKKIKLAAIFATLLFILPSCFNDDGPSETVYGDIVTYMGSTNDRSNFEFQVVNSSPLVHLYANLKITDNGKEIPTGTRMYITYSQPNNRKYGTDGQIELRNVQSVYNASVTSVPAAEATQQASPIAVIAMVRSGYYINMSATLPVINGRKFTIKADETTLGNDFPDLYLDTEAENDPTTYNATYLTSFNIASVWNLSNVQGVNIHVNNDNIPGKKVFTFKKSDPNDFTAPTNL